MDQKTVDTYNKMAKEYDEETSGFWDLFPRTFFDKFTSLIKGKILDIGSGPGRDGLILKEKGLEVICLDASKTMVEMSREKGLDSVVGDFMDIPFSNESFDGVWSFASLLHVSKIDINKALMEIIRILKTGGILGLGLIEGETEGYRESSGVTLPRYFSFYTEEEIEKLLKKYDFEIIYFERLKPRSHTYLNFLARKK